MSKILAISTYGMRDPIIWARVREGILTPPKTRVYLLMQDRTGKKFCRVLR